MISAAAKKTAIISKPPKQPSALKSLLISFFQAKGDMLKMPEKMRVPLKFSVKEAFPNFVVTDGYFYINVHFTREGL